MSTVADVMTPFVRSVRAGQPMAVVRDLMAEEGVHAVPIVDAEGRLVGIISSTDLVEGWSPAQTVDSMMTAPVRTISGHADTAIAAHELLEAGIHHLVVVDGDEPVGMVSALDLLRSVTRTTHPER